MIRCTCVKRVNRNLPVGSNINSGYKAHLANSVLCIRCMLPSWYMASFIKCMCIKKSTLWQRDIE